MLKTSTFLEILYIVVYEAHLVDDWLVLFHVGFWIIKYLQPFQ